MSPLVRLEIDDPRWREFVSAAEAALPFHDPEWALLLAECYHFAPFALALEEDGRLSAGLPLLEVRGLGRGRRWVSLPFTDHCPPLAASPEARARLAAALNVARERADVSRVDLHGELPGAGARSWVAAVTHTLPLGSDPSAVFGTFHRSQVQRSVRKAEQGPLVLRRGESEADLTEGFYRLHLETRRRQGVPVQPRRFFRLLWRRVLEPGPGFLSLACADGMPVAGAVFLASHGTVTYKYGASDPRSLHLRPNHLLFWDAIRWGCEQGYRRFDFGRTELDNRGLREFKSRWGAEEQPLRYSVVAGEAPTPAQGRAVRALGSVIRHSPAWVCRGLGEALYKYAA
jgi:CelD/BcsL family acetyltransferase involved in cellulose biosynthesis